MIFIGQKNYFQDFYDGKNINIGQKMRFRGLSSFGKSSVKPCQVPTVLLTKRNSK